ncbi:hypothetical protein ABPG75_002096 [Micractinium tetrahymenae]
MGCVNSVEDKKAAGALSQSGQSGAFQADAAAAVAQLLGPGAAAHVEIAVKCCGLPDRDVLSKSDAMGVLFASEGYKSEKWSEVGRTDTVANSLAPEFRKPLRATYQFERLQLMRLAVYDVDTRERDNRKLKLGEQDFLGAEHTADRRPSPPAAWLLSAEQLPNTNAVVHMTLAGWKLDNKDTFGKSDPFLQIAKARESGVFVPVLKTEVVDNNLNPQWKPFRASMAQLCNCDEHRPLRIEVFDHDATGEHDLIGACETSLAALQAAAASGQALPLVHPKKAAVPGYVNSGSLVVKGASVVPRPSFLEYIQGGVELSFIVAVDFTGSNGDPRNPQSLHYYSQQPTMYEEAISAVGRVLEHYDTDKNFPAFGFGAALPPSGSTSHCFALNFNPSNPEVAGVQGILQAYRNTLSQVKLSGPTLFTPIISAASQIASQPAAHPKYYVLLILTDGCIMDMANTLSAVVNASSLPLSLLIVGVGNEDFAAMEALDGDKKRIRGPDGRPAARDCVQFCELRPHQRDSVEGLAAKLLAELPGQVVEYFHDMKHMPPPPRHAAAGAASGAPAAGPYPPPAVAATPAASAPPAAVAAPGAYPQTAAAAPQNGGSAQPFPSAYPTI